MNNAEKVFEKRLKEMNAFLKKTGQKEMSMAEFMQILNVISEKSDIAVEDLKDYKMVNITEEEFFEKLKKEKGYEPIENATLKKFKKNNTKIERATIRKLANSCMPKSYKEKHSSEEIEKYLDEIVEEQVLNIVRSIGAGEMTVQDLLIESTLEFTEEVMGILDKEKDILERSLTGKLRAGEKSIFGAFEDTTLKRSGLLN